MEKVIEIKIHNNHDIEVKLDSKQKLLIPKNNREINAEKIYESLEFNKNDSYRLLELESLVLESVGKESKVVKALYDLYSNIISSVLTMDFSVSSVRLGVEFLSIFTFPT